MIDSTESPEAQAAIAAATDGELRLHDPAVRASGEGIRLIHPEFVEIGASGRRWTYEDMVAALPTLHGGAGGPRIEVSAVRGVLLAPDLVHLTYESVIAGRRARRSSLWRKGGDGTGWRLYFHQGTPVPEG
ncbi:nuclear transport factor 2 family protein [Streptomyces roseicoloratus]|uniref:Nuclear transport factor 2 family protein n=1 Tax=Streptomyces roseicoloratus TaxID=2508722 RepID=A0ABY9S2G6_9ACTN|nr:nuclear transport factor 2 family protein [Streptomyces roseicoloratus]WMX48606.1 nuclear transport factor 2 family protein [Streptomyces roseicoloratus]